MSKLQSDFSFRQHISPVRSRVDGYGCHSLTKVGNSYETFNNTSRFEEKKVLRKLREQELLNRMYCIGLFR